MGSFVVKDILIIFLLSIPVVLVLRKVRLPSILGFIVTGALIGPHGLGVIQDKGQLNILAELGIALLLFSVGLEFSLERFVGMRRQGILSGVLQIILTGIAGYVIGYFLNWTPYQGIYFGCLLSLSSTAVVLTTLYDLRRVESVAGQLSTTILILQDLAVIPMMVLLPRSGVLPEGEIILAAMVRQLGMAVLLIIAVGLFTRYLAEPLLRRVSRSESRELFIITVITIALGMSWLTKQMGLSYALGAFLGGIMVGATEYRYQALAEIKPFQFSFNSLFFVSIGMLVNFSFLREHYGIVLLLVILIPLLKVLITSAVVFLNRIPLRLALVVGISLGQIGEFAFLLALLGHRAGVLTNDFYQLAISIAVVTMMITPLIVTHAPRIAEAIARFPLLNRLSTSREETLAHQEAAGLRGHVIICGFGPLGETFGNMLKVHRIPYLVLELNPETITRLKSMNDHAFFGDGASEEILYKCGIETAHLLAITVPDFLNSAAIIRQAKLLNPAIKVITRAKYRNEVEKLYEAGADVVVSEELEGGLEMGRYALKLLQMDKNEVDAFLNKMREFGSADFF
jgi:CPA2 family monovalent cation:H+ antiporter-2